MATIRKRGRSFSVEVNRVGVRRSRSFPSKLEALLWAKTQEEAILREKAPHLVGKLFGDRKSRYPINQWPDPHPPMRYEAGKLQRVDTLSLGQILKQPRFWLSSGVYFLIKDNEVVYVGKSGDVHGRISQHWMLSKDFDSYTYIACSGMEMDELERYYIKSLLPPLNSAMIPKEFLWPHSVG
jgi:hypothetical protein